MMPWLADSDAVAGKAPDAFRDWLAALPEDEPERLAAIGRLLSRVGDRETRPEAFVTMLEQIRLALLPVVAQVLQPDPSGSAPQGADAWRSLSEALTTMGALRTMYRRAATQASREDERSPVEADGEARSLLPLVRALDLQARIVAGLLLRRIEPLAEDWGTLCLLGRQARAIDRLDARIEDALPLVRPVTARALFVYPLLLRLAGLPTRPPAQAETVAGVASRLAARIGFRIDEGAPRIDHPGPLLVLAESWSVRLDTHRIESGLGRRREREAGGDSTPANSLDALMASLEPCWIGEVRMVEPALVAAGAGQLQFGLPRRAAPGPRSRPAAADARQGGGYVFGQWERNTIVRLVQGGGGDQIGADFDPLAGAEPVRWRAFHDAASQEGLVVERSVVLPAARPGALSALRAAAAEGGVAGAGIRLGRVRSVEQLAAPGYERARGQRVVLAPWPGTAVAVGLRLGAARFFDDAWLLRAPAEGGAPQESLLLAPGVVAPGSLAVLREGSQDRSIRFAAVIERGPGFECLGFIVDDKAAP